MQTETQIKVKCERCRYWQDAGGALNPYCACKGSPNEGIHTGAADGCGDYKPAAWVEKKGS